MPFVGLVSDPRWEPPEDQPDRQPHRRRWNVPWRLLAWVAVLVGMTFAVPFVDHELGALAGYGLILLTVTVGAWRLDRWLSRRHWSGLRDYRP